MTFLGCEKLSSLNASEKSSIVFINGILYNRERTTFFYALPRRPKILKFLTPWYRLKTVHFFLDNSSSRQCQFTGQSQALIPVSCKLHIIGVYWDPRVCLIDLWPCILWLPGIGVGYDPKRSQIDWRKSLCLLHSFDFCGDSRLCDMCRRLFFKIVRALASITVLMTMASIDERTFQGCEELDSFFNLDLVKVHLMDVANWLLYPSQIQLRWSMILRFSFVKS